MAFNRIPKPNYNEEIDRTYNLFTLSEVKDHLQQSVSNYFNLYKDNVDELEYYIPM